MYTENRRHNELLESIIRRREKVLRKKRGRDNITDSIALLSHYIPDTVLPPTDSDGLYEYICGKHSIQPHGYSVKIAIEKLPGKSKKRK